MEDLMTIAASDAKSVSVGNAVIPIHINWNQEQNKKENSSSKELDRVISEAINNQKKQVVISGVAYDFDYQLTCEVYLNLPK